MISKIIKFEVNLKKTSQAFPHKDKQGAYIVFKLHNPNLSMIGDFFLRQSFRSRIGLVVEKFILYI